MKNFPASLCGPMTIFLRHPCVVVNFKSHHNQKTVNTKVIEGGGNSEFNLNENFPGIPVWSYDNIS